MSEDPKVIVDSIEKSQQGLIEISEDRTKLRRHPEHPLPEYNEETRKELQSRTCYAKGFPLDSTISDLIDFFNGFEKVTNVVMRKYYQQKDKTYHFKGSVFVTFATKAQCQEFVKKAKIEYKSVSLIRKMQEDYLEQKKKEKSKAEKKKLKKAQQKEEEEKNDDMEIFLPGGTCLKFTTTANKNIKYTDIKQALIKVDDSKEIAFVDFQCGATDGYIRFLIENDAKDYFQKLEEGKLTVIDTEFVFTLLGDEEEREYLEKSAENIKTRLKEGHARRMNLRKGGNRKRRFDNHDRKRKYDNATNGKAESAAKPTETEAKKDDAPPAKQARTEEVTAAAE